jgi:UDP-N-acetylmuramoyl-tripeptide--D-alanyl-D-alanine ligase
VTEISPIALSAGDVAHAVAGHLHAGDPARRLDGFSIDTRTLKPGDLFFAITGERFDGHAFVAAALKAGAAGVVVTRRDVVGDAGLAISGDAAPIVIEVADTTAALQALARDIRRRSGARVIAITGSAGKTTTKEVTAEFLGLKFRTFRNKGNLNNHIGLPLSLLELRTRPQMAVVELGMSAAGEIRTLVNIAEPDVRVWTNVAEAHLESFSSVDAIADAKAEILEGAKATTCLVANTSDARIVRRIKDFPGRVLRYAIDVEADVRAVDVKDLGLDGMRATVTTPVGAAVLTTPLLGRANLSNVLAATAVALDAGVPLADIIGRARTLEPAPHRGQVIRLPTGVTVLDDSYNANPLAMRRALEVLASDRQATRRLAVLGEMLELGRDSVRLHEVCGRAAAEAGVEFLVTVGGPAAKAMGDAAAQVGRRTRMIVRHTDSSDLAADLIEGLVEPGDVVLVKGSRGVRLERVVERLHGARG